MVRVLVVVLVGILGGGVGDCVFGGSFSVAFSISFFSSKPPNQTPSKAFPSSSSSLPLPLPRFCSCFRFLQDPPGPYSLTINPPFFFKKINYLLKILIFFSYKVILFYLIKIASCFHLIRWLICITAPVAAETSSNLSSVPAPISTPLVSFALLSNPKTPISLLLLVLVPLFLFPFSLFFLFLIK